MTDSDSLCLSESNYQISRNKTQENIHNCDEILYKSKRREKENEKNRKLVDALAAKYNISQDDKLNLLGTFSKLEDRLRKLESFDLNVAKQNAPNSPQIQELTLKLTNLKNEHK